jgi:uncharacterized membrane protein
LVFLLFVFHLVSPEILCPLVTEVKHCPVLLSFIVLARSEMFQIGTSRSVLLDLNFKPLFCGTLGRPRRRWEDNIKMDLQEVGWGGMDWIDMAQDRDRWLL